MVMSDAEYRDDMIRNAGYNLSLVGYGGLAPAAHSLRNSLVDGFIFGGSSVAGGGLGSLSLSR
jgi:hypothetical protein